LIGLLGHLDCFEDGLLIKGISGQLP
jgi:hypothetical protein